jgi:diguanylate cyclase (GGDEF)-like protein
MVTDLPGPAPEPRWHAQDALIFRVAGDRLTLVGGSGRGVGWSGIVDLGLGGEPLASRAHKRSMPVQVSEPEPIRIVGPYWASQAVLIPVGTEHLVVFGGLEAPDPSAFLSAAAELVAELRQVSPAKLLADELEVVHAIRDLMEYRPEELAATARHIAAKSAEPLSCEVGAVLVRHGNDLVAEVVTRDWPAVLDPEAIRDTLARLYQRALGGPVLESELEAAADDALGREQGLVARFAVPIGRPEPFGVLVVAHAASKPRGFTNLCQRIGSALAEAAEPLLIQARAREELAADRDRFAREARTDPLTGLANRSAWEELLRLHSPRQDRYHRPISVVSADLDGLKVINDREGHAAGDDRIRAAAEVLKLNTRAGDVVARVGGDEFFVLLAEADQSSARRYLRRVRAAVRRTNVAQGRSPLHVSLGAATAREHEPLSETVRRADRAMYTSKKRRASERAK